MTTTVHTPNGDRIGWSLNSANPTGDRMSTEVPVPREATTPAALAGTNFEVASIAIRVPPGLSLDRPNFALKSTITAGNGRVDWYGADADSGGTPYALPGFQRPAFVYPVLVGSGDCTATAWLEPL